MTDTDDPRQKRTGRPAWSYRGARKKAEREHGAAVRRHAPETMETIAPAAYLNRSDRWPRVMDYRLAREQSGKKDPVR
ncbi:MAG: hypothetical protein PS018_17260 [bacterium]|nr:hypothetical protein [bacterium]